jgi:hypothetical protein
VEDFSKMAWFSQGIHLHPSENFPENFHTFPRKNLLGGFKHGFYFPLAIYGIYNPSH